MLSWLVSTSIRLRVVLVVLCIVLLMVGYQSIRRAPLDVFPEFAPPIVEIQTEAPGLSSEQVENLVTMPLENTLTGIPKVKAVRSKSVLGLSQVVLILDQGTDHLKVRQIVQERVAAEARQLPSVAKPPVILQPLSSTSRVLKIGLWSATLSQRDLTLLALWTIRPKLMSVPGVANVAIWGQRDTQFQVLVDPDLLRANGISLDAVVNAAGDAAALETGGFLDTPNQRLAVRHLSPILEPEDLGRTVVDFRGGAPIRLADVTDVTIGSPPPIGDAVINDGPGLLLIVEKQPEGNTLEVTRKVEEALEILKPALKDVEIDSTIFRPATFIERAMYNLTRALAVGCILVIVILVAFLFDWRTALISMIAVPLSLVIAVLLITWSGATVNTMVLAGLVIALGELVDDSIIDVENIIRRLRLNRAAGNPRVRVPGRAGRLARSPQRRGLRQPDRRAGVLAGVLLGGAGGGVFPPTGAGLRAGHPGLPGGGLDGHSRLVVHAADGPSHPPAGGTADPAAQGRLPAPALGVRCSPVSRPEHPLGHVRGDRGSGHAAGTGVSAEVPGDGLPHALCGEAGHLDRGDAAGHGPGQQGTAGHPRRAELRVAHRPGRGGG